MKTIETAKPILFNTQMVQAILDGRKTHTRRVVPDRFDIFENTELNMNGEKNIYPFTITDKKYLNIYDTQDIRRCFNSYINYGYKVGDVLYVRETWQYYNYLEPNDWDIIFKASPELFHWDIKTVKWKPSIHMPKKYARIFLKVTEVRVEKLQDINNEDIKREGIVVNEHQYAPPMTWNEAEVLSDMEYRNKWINLWNSTTPDGKKWHDNPDVFVIGFERIEIND